MEACSDSDLNSKETTEGRLNRGAAAGQPPLVAVVIPCYNHARYLGEAVESVLAQTVQDFEIVVVDDGSTDSTAEVAARYSRVRYVRQNNQGLSAARNTGIKHSTGRFLVFLDADDLLLPGTLAAGLRCFESNPQSAFVSGTYRHVTETRTPIYTYVRPPITGSHYLAFLHRNYIGMHATVMYQRKIFEKMGGFDPRLHACEDYDMYLRISRENPVAAHDELVAEYRLHDTNMSGNLALMARTSTKVLKRQRPFLADEGQRAAYREGLSWWRKHYTSKMLLRLEEVCKSSKMFTEAPKLAIPFLFIAPGTLAKLVAVRLRTLSRRFLQRLLPSRVGRRSGRAAGHPPPVGQVDFGDLRNLQPVSRSFGFDRGQPVDRYYIEGFLAQHADDIRGRVLEIGGNDYTVRFGGNRVSISDVLHVEEGNPKATIVGDISQGENLPSNAFNCVVLTQTLHLIYDVKAAIATLHRILKPGGVLLLTIPGTISQLEKGPWARVWYWGFTELSIRKLTEDQFSSEDLTIQVHGNVLASIAFLEGIAAGELTEQELALKDPLYPLLITVRARKRSGAGEPKQ